MRFSHSRVEAFNKCPYNFKSKYVDNINILLAPEFNDARIVGNAVHLLAEKGLNEAIEFYKSQYPLMTNTHVNEIVKFEAIAPKLSDFLALAGNCIHEYRISTAEFTGIVDLIIRNPDGTIDIIDFKYSNNIEKYLESSQLHIYKYYLEQQGFTVNKMGFLFIPKLFIRQKKLESIEEFRKRIKAEIESKDLILIDVEYDHSKVEQFLNDVKDINHLVNLYEDTTAQKYLDFKKNPSKLCDWCDYKEFCMKGHDYMILPSNKRRKKEINTNPDFWIYADSYVGKSTFVDQIDDLLFLNTDGKTKNTTAPVIHIADKIESTGRTIKTTLAWQIFLDVVAELEKGENDFKAIALDLVEDLYEHCRLWVFDKNKWEHEADGGYGKGYDMVKLEFLSTIKRLKNLGYQIIYISKENRTEVTTRQGGSYTTFAPNIKPVIANVLSGTVDMTIRAFVDGRKRYLELGKNDNSFGGGIYEFPTKRIELNMALFKQALRDAQSGIESTGTIIQTEESKPVQEPTEPQMEDGKLKVADGGDIPFEPTPAEEQEPFPRRSRRSKE